MGKKTTQQHVVSLLNIITGISLVLAVVFIVLLFLAKNDNVQLWYKTYQETLSTAEQTVEHMDDKAYIFIVLIFLYAFKALFPIYLYPLPALCAVTSTVFEPYFSIPINVLGLIIMYSLKYAWGVKLGANSAQMILKRNETVQYLIERDGTGNPWLLSLFRLIPVIPKNLISQLYGAMGFDYCNFILLSLLGYAPFLISYTFIGRSVFNPLSTAFILPFILLFTFLGIISLATSKFLQIQTRRKQKND